MYKGRSEGCAPCVLYMLVYATVSIACVFLNTALTLQFTHLTAPSTALVTQFTYLIAPSTAYDCLVF